jgi:CheY-like chemotaxis protein
VEQHAPDVVLLDIGLPGMSGYDVARELRRRPKFQDLMLVAMTGYGQESDRQRSHAAGFDHHLVKPVSIDTLQELLSKAPQRVAAERDATSPSHAGSAGAGTCVGMQVVPWTRS